MEPILVILGIIVAVGIGLVLLYNMRQRRSTG